MKCIDPLVRRQDKTFRGGDESSFQRKLKNGDSVDSQHMIDVIYAEDKVGDKQLFNDLLVGFCLVVPSSFVLCLDR